MLRKAILLLLVAMISTTAVSAANDIFKESTDVRLANKTGHSVYVDAIIQGNLVPHHFGLVRPNDTVMVRVGTGQLKVLTDIYVYVKAEHTEDASKTICTARKTFGSTADGPALEESVHYDGKHCWIAP